MKRPLVKPPSNHFSQLQVVNMVISLVEALQTSFSSSWAGYDNFLFTNTTMWYSQIFTSLQQSSIPVFVCYYFLFLNDKKCNTVRKVFSSVVVGALSCFIAIEWIKIIIFYSNPDRIIFTHVHRDTLLAGDWQVTYHFEIYMKNGFKSKTWIHVLRN